MTAQTGRTVFKYTALLIKQGGSMRTIPLASINGLGLEWEERDITAWSDAIRGALLGLPSCQITFTTPFDNTATTGSFAVLSALAGAQTPLSVDVQVGIRHAWEPGEPQFGITAGATDGMLLSALSFDPESSMLTGKLVMNAGSAAPAWGTAAES